MELSSHTKEKQELKEKNELLENEINALKLIMASTNATQVEDIKVSEDLKQEIADLQ